MGELRARVHLPVAGRRGLLDLRAGVRGRRAADDLERGHRRARAAARGAGVRRGGGAVPGRGRDLSVGATADRPALGVADGLDLRVGADRHRRVGLHRRGDLRRLAVRVHAEPLHDGADRGCADAAVPADQPERDEDARPGGDGRVRGRADRRAVRRDLPAAVRAPPGLRRVLRRARDAGRRLLRGRVPRRVAARPVPVLRLRGVRRRRRGGAGPGPHDPDRDAAHDLHRRRRGAADHRGADPRPARLLGDPQRRAGRSGGRGAGRRVRHGRLEGHHRDRADLVPVVRPEPAGGGEPARSTPTRAIG